MKAAVYFGKNDVRVMDIEKPGIGPRDVRIAIEYCGVCGTDLHIFHGDGGAAPVPVGTIIGHEFSGVVEAVGAEVKSFKVGDRVSADPNDWCGECYFCRNGKAHFCTAMKGYGTTYPGGFAEYVTVPEKQVYHLPDCLDFQAGSQSETTSCCINGIDRATSRRDRPCWSSCGPHRADDDQLAKYAGAGKVLVSELVEGAATKSWASTWSSIPKPRTCGGDPPMRELTMSSRCQHPFTQAQLSKRAGKTLYRHVLWPRAPETEIKVKTLPFNWGEHHLSFINPHTFPAIAMLVAARHVGRGHHRYCPREYRRGVHQRVQKTGKI